MMPVKSENKGRQLDQSVLQSSIYSQPWWRGVGNSPGFGESILKSSSTNHLNDSLYDGTTQANSAPDNGANSNKDTQMAVASQSDGNNGQEHSLKQVPSSTPVTVSGHLEPNSQMELVGHSIVLTPYPYSDAQFSGMLPYTPQAMVPQLYGINHARMPLPLQMEEEPVYVNAKQFHGIMRRRQARAKAELEKKAIKARKPYLHESRHQHAMKRARGCGGRFLSSKKLEKMSLNPASKNDVSSYTDLSTQSAISPGSKWSQKDGTRDSDSSIGWQEGNGLNYQDTQSHSSSNGNGSCHGLSSIYHPSSGVGVERGFLGQLKETAHRNGISSGALPNNRVSPLS